MPLAYNSGNNDPKLLAENNRGLIQQSGDQLLEEQRRRAAAAQNNAGQTQDWLNSYLQPDVEGNGGYNPEEAAAIQNSGALDQYGLTPEQAQSNFLTPEEQAAIKGNPNYHANFDPASMSQAQDVSAGRQRGAVTGLKQGLSSAIDPGALRQSSKSQQDSENQLQANQGQFGTVLGAEANNVRGAIDPNAVNPSSDFLADYDMTPEEQQNIITGAGISAGAGYRASEGTIDRAARAAGASPMGVAAYRARSERDAAAAGGDAMTQARIAASNTAAQRELQGEQLRENAGQFLTNTKTGTELAMGGQALEGTRALGEQALGQRNQEEQNRQAAEQYLTGANLNAATTGGEAEIANEANVNAQGRQQGQFNATTGAGIAQAEDTAAAARAGTVATNRQNTGVANQNTGYQQGLTKTALGSQQAKTVADTRLGARQAGIQNFTGQQQQQNQNVQNEANRNVQTFGVQAGAGNTATGLGINASGVPTTTDKIIGAGLGAASAFLADGDIVNDPTLAVVGDDGPEWIGKVGKGLGGIANSGIMRPSPYSKMGADLGKTLRGGIDHYRARKRERDIATATIDPQVSHPERYGAAPDMTDQSYNFPRPDAMSDGQIVTQPTLALVGEDGPEQVVPLGYRAKAKVRPQSLGIQPMRQRRVYGEAA